MYKSTVDVTSALYKGSQYLYYDSRIEGHQFFEEEDWSTGDVVYEGQRYEDVLILFDIAKEALILEHNNLAYAIQLENRWVDEFFIRGHHFVKLAPDSLGVLDAGFYDIIYRAEDIEFLIRRKKLLKKENEGQVVKRYFDQEDRFFIKKDGVYHKVRRKGSVMRVFEKQDRKKLRKYTRKNWIQFGKTPEQGILATVRYYNETMLGK